jgi:integrase/recombinase XerD
LSVAFLVEPIRWQHFPLASGQPCCRAWLTFQSQRGLSRNTLEAYSRGLEVFLRFLADRQLAISAVTRAHICAYLAALQGNRRTISNATLQQRVTVLRLFYGYLVEEKVCHKNPVFGDGGRMLVRRYSKLPWIPTEMDWQSILSATRAEPIRNRAMLAFAYDAALRREELCGLRTDDIDPSHRMLRIRAENTKGRRDRIVPYSAASGDLLQHYLYHRRGLGQGADRSFYPSPDATMLRRSPSGPGRRSFFGLQDVQ